MNNMYHLAFEFSSKTDVRAAFVLYKHKKERLSASLFVVDRGLYLPDIDLLPLNELLRKPFIYKGLQIVNVE